MWRFIKEAFWAKATLPGIGPLPINALAVFAVGTLGFAEHAFWLLGAGLETAYLFALATNARFQNVVTARDLARERQTTTQSRRERLAQLSADARRRAESLESKIDQIAKLYQTNSTDNFLQDSSLDALQKLGALYLRLLCVERDLQNVHQQADEAALARQAASLEKELSSLGERVSVALRESKKATLELTQKRLANAKRRTESLAEVESDLVRIETQVDLALEDAGMEGKPTVGESNLNLLNRILESNSALSGELAAFPDNGNIAPRAEEKA